MKTALDIILFIMPILSVPTCIALFSGMKFCYDKTDTCETDKKSVESNILNLKIFNCILAVLSIAALIINIIANN